MKNFGGKIKLLMYLKTELISTYENANKIKSKEIFSKKVEIFFSPAIKGINENLQTTQSI